MMSNKPQDTKKKPAGGPGLFASLYQRLQEKTRADEEAKKNPRSPFPGCLLDRTWEPSDEDLRDLVRGIGEEARQKLMRVLKEEQQ